MESFFFSPVSFFFFLQVFLQKVLIRHLGVDLTVAKGEQPMLIVRAQFTRGLTIVLTASRKGLFSVAAPLAPFVPHVSMRRGSRRALRCPWLRRAAGGRCCSPRRAGGKPGGQEAAAFYRPKCVLFSAHDSDVESVGAGGC